jgi:hypothetical protein
MLASSSEVDTRRSMLGFVTFRSRDLRGILLGHRGARRHMEISFHLLVIAALENSIFHVHIFLFSCMAVAFLAC